MLQAEFDVIIIGGGHNGLTAALLLAQAGRKVVLLEARDAPGGRAAPVEFHPGYRVPGLLHDTACVDRRLFEELGVSLSWRDPPPVVAPAGGKTLTLNWAKRSIDGPAVQSSDQRALETWHAFLQRLYRVLVKLMRNAPLDPFSARSVGLFRLARTAITLRRLGARDLMELLRVGPMCLADWLGDTFKCPKLQSLVALPSLIGEPLGPWSAGSSLLLLLQAACAGQEVVGGPAALVAALAAQCERKGVAVRTGCRALRLEITQARVTGVRTSSGDLLTASQVLSCCDPKQTLQALLPPGVLQPRVARKVAVYRQRGTAAKIDLALSYQPQLTSNQKTFERLRSAASLIELEQASDAAKYHDLPVRPALDVRIPSASDPQLCPSGHAVASIWVHSVPYEIEGGWTADRRQQLADRVLQILSESVENIREHCVGHHVQAPPDLEKNYRLTGGHIYHGERGLDQLYMLRPFAACSDYRSPIPGLYLGGSGCHPGGELSGLPGALAARTIVADG